MGCGEYIRGKNILNGIIGRSYSIGHPRYLGGAILAVESQNPSTCIAI
jgi:hypothetical protein